MNFKSSWPNRIVLSFAVLVFASDVLSQDAKAQLPSNQLSRFEAHADVGIAPLQGAVTFGAATGEYRITGGGANMWGQADAFQPHDANVLEAALSSNISAQKPTPVEQNQNPSNVRSKISIYDLDSKSIRVVYTADKLWEAPNWSPDGKYLLANSGGALYRFPLNADEKAQPEKLSLDAAYECNNDHGITRDGKLLAFSAKHGAAQESRVFVASSDGANPRLLTPNSPSYFHGWSPDGKWLAFVGKRGDNSNIFRIPVGDGGEQRLTSSPVADDGPDYSPDGKWIYINSNRSGGWDIWRFPPKAPVQTTRRLSASPAMNWKTGSRILRPTASGWSFCPFPRALRDTMSKPRVQLRMIPMPRDAVGKGAASSIQVLTQIFGGQGTINVNSWSPDSKKFAFVNYELLP